MGWTSMDCQTCGRYRPTREIETTRMPGFGLILACARCRRSWPSVPGPGIVVASASRRGRRDSAAGVA